MGMHGFQFYTIIRNGNCECCKQAWLYSYVRRLSNAIIFVQSSVFVYNMIAKQSISYFMQAKYWRTYAFY